MALARFFQIFESPFFSSAAIFATCSDESFFSLGYRRRPVKSSLDPPLPSGRNSYQNWE